MKTLAVMVIAGALAGCGSNDYYKSVDRANDGLVQAAKALSLIGSTALGGGIGWLSK